MLLELAGVPLARMSVLFAGLFILGVACTLPLFKWHLREFMRSKIFIKILLWLPIFGVFVGFLYLETAGRLLLLLILCAMALRELLGHAKGKPGLPFFLNYYFLFAVALLHFLLIGTAFGTQATDILVAICFASVLSDVCAFFFGRYFGRHALPAALNKNKSWEGVIGQVVGALVGVFLVHASVAPVYGLWLFVPIGVGAAAGDLLNSYAKRRLNIAEWGNGIPGHGGYLDRLASLAGSALLAYYGLIFS